MPVAINKTELASYLISKAIENGGGLKVDPGASIEEKKDGEGNFISWVWNGTKALWGFAVSAVNALAKTFSFSALVANFIQGVRFVLTFDIGQDDKSIDNEIKNLWNTWKLQAAGALGNATGWFVCGGVANALIFVFNPIAAAETLKESGEEAFEELLYTLGAMTRLTVQNAAKTAGLTAFKNIRRWLREPGNPIYPLLPQSLKDAWQNKKPWTLGSAIQRRIISWFPASWKELIEEFMEETLDACQEALMVVASSLDRFVAERRSGILGSETVLEITPNRKEPKDKYLLAGPQEIVRAQVVQTLTDRRWLANKDLGLIVDEAQQEILLAAQPFTLYGHAIFKSIDGKGPGRRPEYKLPALDRTKIDDYDRVRTAFGGSNGYFWGRFIATATTTIGHPIICRGATSEAAQERVVALASLCDLEIIKINVNEEIVSHRRAGNPLLRKTAKQVLPHLLIIKNRKYYTEPRPGAQPSLNGWYEDYSVQLDVSSPVRPPDWAEQIADVLRGPNPARP